MRNWRNWRNRRNRKMNMNIKMNKKIIIKMNKKTSK